MGIDTPKSYRDAQRMKAAEERARKNERLRIRRKLLAELEPEIRIHRIAGSQLEVDALLYRDFQAALDRICPEQPESFQLPAPTTGSA